MCLAIPGQIEKIEGQKGSIFMAGNHIEALLDLVPEAVVGDWVLVHAGVVITLLDADEAKETYDLLMKMQSND